MRNALIGLAASLVSPIAIVVIWYLAALWWAPIDGVTIPITRRVL